MFKALSHVAVSVTDLKPSLDWYTGPLGLKVKFSLEREDGQPWLVYLQVAPRQFVELFPRADSPYQQTTSAGPMHLCLEVEDIQAWHAEFVSRGGVPHSEPRLGADGAWQFWTNDPDGNPIEFHQFTPGAMQTA